MEPFIWYFLILLWLWIISGILKDILYMDTSLGRRIRGLVTSVWAVEQEEPVRAYKIAFLDYKGQEITGPVSREAYQLGEIEQAVCNITHGRRIRQRHYRHSSPDPRGVCLCGFNAFNSFNSAITEIAKHSIHEVLLVVDLYGTIVEYDRGYRAEYQRIVEVLVSYNHAYFDPFYSLGPITPYNRNAVAHRLQRLRDHIQVDVNILEEKSPKGSRHYGHWQKEENY